MILLLLGLLLLDWRVIGHINFSGLKSLENGGG